VDDVSGVVVAAIDDQDATAVEANWSRLGRTRLGRQRGDLVRRKGYPHSHGSSPEELRGRTQDRLMRIRDIRGLLCRGQIGIVVVYSVGAALLRNLNYIKACV
jgi:hypothetical protein